jgi:hypothetical protein
MLAAVNPAWYNTAQNFNLQLLAGSPAGDSDDVDQSFRSDADQRGAKRRRALSV